MRSKPWFIMCCLFLLTAGLMAQEFEQSSRVLLREVRMHIVDKDGNHVPGLKPSDFSVIEDEQDYKLSFFEEVDRSKPTALATKYKEIEGVQSFSDSHQTGPRRLTLILDSANLQPHHFKEVVKEMETFLFEKVDPSTLIQIIQVDGDIYPLTGYTPDRNQLREALGSAKYYGKLYKQLKSLENGILNTISQSIMLDAANSFAAPPEDPIRPRIGFDTDVGNTFRSSVDLDVRQKAYFKQLHYRKFTVQMLRIAHAMRAGKGSQSVLLVTGGQFIEEYGLYPRSVTVAETLAQAYNGIGIPLFTHLVKPKTALMEDTARIQGNMTLSGGGGLSWDYDTLSRASTFDPNREDRIRIGPYRSTVMENLYHMDGAPRYASEWTGGQLTLDNNTSSLDQRLVQMFDASGKYYRLGYTRFIDEVPRVVKTKITVRGAKENNWDVRYGKEALPTYGLNDRPDNVEVDKIPEKPTESISRMMHLGEPGKNDFNISEGLYVFPGKDKGIRIPVYMRLPKPANPAEKGYEFGFAAIGDDGALLDHTVFGLDYGYDNESILFYDVLMPETKPKEIRYFIREIGSDTLSFKSVPFSDTQIPTITELLVSDVANEDFVISPHHIRANDKARAAADPLLLKDAIFPFTPGELTFNKPESLRFFFALNDGKVGNPVEFEMWLEEENEEELVPQHKVQMLPMGEDGLKRFQGIIEASSIPPGNYQLYVRVIDSQADKEYEQTKGFKVVWQDN